MLNQIRAELFRTRKSMSFRILLGISTGSAILMVWITHLITQGKLTASMMGIGFMFSDVNIISILGGIFASILICGDFENKTIHNTISSGASRSSIIISKAFVLALGVTVLLLPYAIITTVALYTGSEYQLGAPAVGFLNLLSSESGTAFSAATFWNMLSLTFTLMIVFPAQLSLCVPLAFFLKKPVFVVAIYNGFSILIAQLLTVSKDSPVFERLLSFTPYGANHAVITFNTGLEDMAKSIVISLIFALLMIAVTNSVFKKAEIK